LSNTCLTHSPKPTPAAFAASLYAWNGATVRFQVSDDNVTFQNLTDEKGYAIGLYGDDFASLLDIPSGTWFKVAIADSGSPVSSLTVKASGDVESV
jgi:hypothetical protein